MRFNTLIAVAVAGAFAVPFAALAQGAGGTTTAPSATHPQGNPPFTAPAGSQDDAATGTTDKRAKSKANKEDQNARRSGDTGAGSTSSGSGASSSTPVTPKSPSSGGEPQSSGAATPPKGN